MFGKKNRNPFLKMFEDVQNETAKNKCDNTKEMSIKEKIKAFFKCFKYQSAEYKIVWSIRILVWILICVVAIFGTVIRIKELFF